MKSAVYCCQLSKGVMAEVIISGVDGTGPETCPERSRTVNAKEIEMLRRYLELTKSALDDGDLVPVYPELVEGRA